MRLLLFGILGVACSCSLIPECVRPSPPIAASWPSGAGYRALQAVPEVSAPELGWEEFLTHSRLRELIRMALAENRDLKLALLSVEKARALHGIQRAQLFPSLEAVAS